MATIKKAVVSACIMLILIIACIGTASAAVNIWGADSSSKDSQTNDPAYNQKVAAENPGVWFYDSETKILWTTSGAKVLPVYMNVTDTSTNVFGYNLTLIGAPDTLTVTAKKGDYPAAYNITGAKISASVSQGNGTAITNTVPANIVNALFNVAAVTGPAKNYSIGLSNTKLATGSATISSLADLSGATIANYNKVIAFQAAENKPVVESFSISNAANISVDNPISGSTLGTLYFYQERDNFTDGTANKLNVIIENNDGKYIWNLVNPKSGELNLNLNPTGKSDSNFTRVILTGDKGVGKYVNQSVNLTLTRTSESYFVNINATYWNQSVTLADASTVGKNVTLNYKVAAVPGDYVTGADSKWDTFVELYPIGTAEYQNYTIYGTDKTGTYDITNSTGKTNADTGVKNLTITKSTYTGNAGPIAIALYSGKNGDPNEDNIVDIVDAAGVGIETIRAASQADDSILHSAQQQFLADVDKSGIVTVADVLAIHAYIITQMS